MRISDWSSDVCSSDLTVKALLGILPVSEGAVARRPGLTIGYVPQRLAVDWTLPLTVRRLMTLTGRHEAAEIKRTLAEVGIGHIAAAPVQQRSDGELHRALLRSGERRVGKASDSTCRSRWSPYH